MIIIDTNLYIAFKCGRHLDVYESMMFDRPVHLSSIVALELFAGAKSSKSQKNVEVLWARYKKIDRILSPSVQGYKNSGKLIQKMTDQRKDVMSDVLIAVSARESGAEVWTCDKDFLRILDHLDFKVKMV